MINKENSERSTWVIHREYTDSKGNAYIEYKDLLGAIHTESKNAQNNAQSYRNGYVASQITEENNKEKQVNQAKRADKNISKGLLLGVIVTCVAGLSAGLIYFLANPYEPQPAAIISVPRDQSTPTATPSPTVRIVEKEVVKIVPVPEAQPRDIEVNVTTQTPTPKPVVKQEATKSPAKASTTIATPAVTTPVPNNVTNNIKIEGSTNVVPTTAPINSSVRGNEASPNLARPDNDLKNDILQKFQAQFSNNQLSVDVNMGSAIVSGTVTRSEQLQQIKPLVTSVQGITKVEVNATVKMPSN